jgi:hypothetical protein
MIEGQKQRFQESEYLNTIQNYVDNPAAYEAEYLKMMDNESIAQYKDYFKSEND